MANSIGQRLMHAWNAFTGTSTNPSELGPASYSQRPGSIRWSFGTDKSMVTSMYTRIAIDTAALEIRHVRLDDNDQYVEELDSYLNNCLKVEANIDQSSRAFIINAVLALFDEGAIAIVPVDTTLNPNITGAYDVQTMRVGSIVEWMPQHVKVRVYNEKTGSREDVILSKRLVAIVENPLYAVMNERNSTLQRLIRKLSLLDSVDEQTSSGKLDIIIQLPYVIKTEARKAQADLRRKELEDQLQGSKYGIAYTDGTERVTQLNRPAENNLLKQIEYLTAQLYSQLGLTQAVIDGTADEKTMINYYNRTVEPVLSAIVDAMKRTFLTKTARAQNQSIIFLRDPFKLVPVSEIAEIADKFTRNEIATANEIRSVIGWRPSKDPGADQLRNKNLNQPGALPPGSDQQQPALPPGSSQPQLEPAQPTS